MSRLYDRIVRDTIVKYGKAPYFVGCPVILADNVADYVWNNRKTFQQEDFPNLAPPFEHMFVEFSPPTTEGKKIAFGFEVTGYDLDKKSEYRQLEEPIQVVGGQFNSAIINEPKWSCIVRIFLDPLIHTNKYGEWEWRYYVSQSGKAMKIASDNDAYCLHSKSGIFEEMNATIESWFSGMFQTVMMTITFMHSKNVELIEQIPPAKLSRKAEKKYGQPLTRYCVIKVNPMRTLKRPTGETDIEVHKSQSHRPMTIVRGHFKDFRDGKGLFGKYRDIYWWDQHLVGDPEIGVIEKDYEVLAPKGD